MSFYKMVLIDNWGYKSLVPDLEPKDRELVRFMPEEGSRIRLRTPDGKTGDYEITYRKNTETVSDHGKSYEVTSTIPGFMLKASGIDIWHSLEGIEVDLPEEYLRQFTEFTIEILKKKIHPVSIMSDGQLVSVQIKPMDKDKRWGYYVGTEDKPCVIVKGFPGDKLRGSFNIPDEVREYIKTELELEELARLKEKYEKSE